MFCFAWGCSSSRLERRSGSLVNHFNTFYTFNRFYTSNRFYTFNISQKKYLSLAFANDQANMYKQLFERLKLTCIPITSEIDSEKRIGFRVSGNHAGMLAHEAGVHRVQRVPANSGIGRIHTSTTSISVIPITQTSQTYDKSEFKVEYKNSSGPGGRNVNKTESAVRITHLPTGLCTTIQNERSRHLNESIALKSIYAQLAALEDKKQSKEIDGTKRSQERLLNDCINVMMKQVSKTRASSGSLVFRRNQSLYACCYTRKPFPPSRSNPKSNAFSAIYCKQQITPLSIYK